MVDWRSITLKGVLTIYRHYKGRDEEEGCKENGMEALCNY